MSTVSARIYNSISLSVGGDPVLGVSPQWAQQMVFASDMVNGVAQGQFDLGYMAERTIVGAITDSVDLRGGIAMADASIINATEIALIFIINAPRDPAEAPNTGLLTIGAGTNPITGILTAAATLGPIRPGNFLMFGGPHVGGAGIVTAATGDILSIANSGGTTKYQICALLRST